MKINRSKFSEKIFNKYFIILFVTFLMTSNSRIFSICKEGNCDNGTGTVEFDDGSKYSGEFKSGNPDGEGTYITSDKYKFKGTWRFDSTKRASDFVKGTLEYPKDGTKHKNKNWKKYEGPMKYFEDPWMPVPHGKKGMMTYRNGELYIGAWKQGKREGKGVQYKKISKSKKWRDDQEL